MFNAAHWS